MVFRGPRLCHEKPVCAYTCQGNDTGDKLGYVEAIVDVALEDKDIGEQFSEYPAEMRLH